MNLQSTFPEIHKFFERDHFDSDELKSLEDSIISNYKENYTYVKAYGYLKLELLKFQILVDDPSQRALNQNTSRRTRKSLIEVSDKVIFPKELYNLCVKLKYSRSELDHLCLTNGVNIIESYKLNNDDFEKLKSVFQSRYDEIKALEQKEFNKKSKLKESISINNPGSKFQKQKSWTGNVYDLVGKYGLGKIIYIRSR